MGIEILQVEQRIHHVPVLVELVALGARGGLTVQKSGIPFDLFRKRLTDGSAGGGADQSPDHDVTFCKQILHGGRIETVEVAAIFCGHLRDRALLAGGRRDEEHGAMTCYSIVEGEAHDPGGRGEESRAHINSS